MIADQAVHVSDHKWKAFVYPSGNSGDNETEVDNLDDDEICEDVSALEIGYYKSTFVRYKYIIGSRRRILF